MAGRDSAQRVGYCTTIANVITRLSSIDDEVPKTHHGKLIVLCMSIAFKGILEILKVGYFYYNDVPFQMTPVARP